LRNFPKCAINALVSNECNKKPTKKPLGRPAEFPGLTEDAATLDVSRYFLWKVLKGYAASAPLLKRYRQLKSKQ
jgi:hypothetical protein